MRERKDSYEALHLLECLVQLQYVLKSCIHPECKNEDSENSKEDIFLLSARQEFRSGSDLQRHS